MSAVNRALSQWVWEHSGAECAYCGRRLVRREATVDHWVPRFHGGGDGRTNLRCACEPCNTTKGNLWPHEWAPIAALRRAAQDRGRVPAQVSRIALLQRCAPRWREKQEGSACG